jgi:hypothetical protein
MKKFLILTLIVGCTPVTTERWGYNIQTPPYDITTMPQVTPLGVRFDSSGQVISGELIDRLVSEVEQCVGKSIDRDSFIVKIPNNWILNCDGSQQELSQSRASEAGCLAKGLKYDPKCPCMWRARIQWPNVIVTTPSMYLMKDALTRFVTGSSNPWQGALAKCASPSTGPLDMGN